MVHRLPISSGKLCVTASRSASNFFSQHEASSHSIFDDLSPLPCERRGVLRQFTVPGKKALQHHCPREAGLRQGVTDSLQKPHLTR